MSLRGEVRLEVLGCLRTLTPDYRAMEAIPARLGQPLDEVFGRALVGDIRLRDLAVVVHEGMGAPESPTAAEIAEDAMRNLDAYADATHEFLVSCYGGPPKKRAGGPAGTGRRLSVAEQFEVATGLLGIAPSEFRRLTPMELDALCGAKLKANPKYVEPISREEHDALVAQVEQRGSR